MAAGASLTVLISVPAASVSAPGVFTFTSNAGAIAANTQSKASCSLQLEAVQLSTNKCCAVTSPNTGLFRVSISSVGDSPQTVIRLRDVLVTPPGVVLQFTSFDDLIATFSDGTPVPLNTDIVNRQITISSNPLTIPAGGGVHKDIQFKVISVTAFQSSPISNEFTKLDFLNPTPQINLGAGPLPINATINVTASLQCTAPCS